MKNHNPAGGQLRFANTRQRLVVVLLLCVLVALVWAARSGRYDREIGRLSHRLEAGYGHVAAFIRRHTGG